MGLFRRKRRLEVAENRFTNRLRGKMVFWFRDRERHLANYLNRKTKTWGYRSWLILLISFCMVAGGYLIYLLIGIFN